MMREGRAVFRAVLPLVLLLLGAIPAVATPLPNTIASLNITGISTAIIILFAFIILILGLLLKMCHIRTRLEKKTQSMKKNERHIQLLGDSLPNLTIFELTYATGIFQFTYLSKGYERAIGFERTQTLADARLAFDHVYEADAPLLRKAFRESVKKQVMVDFELRVLDTSGQLKWLHVSATPRKIQGELIWDGFLQDISVSKQMEDALVEENLNFHNLFETINDFLIIFDMEGLLIHVNPSVVMQLGYTRTELRKMSLFELYPQKSRKEIYQVVAYMQSEKATTCRVPLLTKSGKTIPVEMNIFQGSWENNQAIFGVARDIGHRQEIESALRESQQMLQLIMDTIPMSVFWKDKDSVYLGCNKTFVRECGVQSANDIVGKTPFDLFDPSVAPGVVDRDQKVIDANSPIFNLLQAHPHSDGSISWREISKIPLHDEKGHAVGVLGVWRDVTEQNHAEEHLKQTLEDMERFNQLMRGRERRTLELKAEINLLLQQLGQPERYRTTTIDS